MNFVNLGNGKIERVAHPEDVKHTIKHPFLDVQRRHLVATNGCALVVSTVVVDEGDVSGYITVEALTAYRAALAKVPNWQKKHRVRFEALADELVVTDNDGNRHSFKRPELQGGFPNYPAVVPVDREQPAILIDFDHLKKVVDALGYPETRAGKSSMVALFFGPRDDKGRDPVVLIKTSENGPIGLLMPMLSQEAKWLTTIEAMDARRAQLEGAAVVSAPVAEVEAADEAAAVESTEFTEVEEVQYNVGPIDESAGDPQGLHVVGRKEAA